MKTDLQFLQDYEADDLGTTTTEHFCFARPHTRSYLVVFNRVGDLTIAAVLWQDDTYYANVGNTVGYAHRNPTDIFDTIEGRRLALKRACCQHEEDPERYRGNFKPGVYDDLRLIWQTYRKMNPGREAAKKVVKNFDKLSAEGVRRQDVDAVSNLLEDALRVRYDYVGAIKAKYPESRWHEFMTEAEIAGEKARKAEANTDWSVPGGQVAKDAQAPTDNMKMAQRCARCFKYRKPMYDNCTLSIKVRHQANENL